MPLIDGCRFTAGLFLAAMLLVGPLPAAAQSGKAFVYQPPLRGAPSSAVRVGGGTRGEGFKPPLRGAPSSSVRVGGGTRGEDQGAFVLSALVPDHVGLTSREQPTLYWFNGAPITTTTELTVIEGEGYKTLLEITLEPPIAAGVHALRLSDHGVRLKPDVYYQWFVAMVVDPQSRSSDIAAAGEIQRVAPSPEVVSGIAGARPEDAPAIYAAAGLWYDTLDALGQLIDRAPGDAALREQRATLLDQVGLARSARFERGG